MGSFLDIRGAVADFVREHGLFRHWQIGANRVDFWNAEDREEDPEKAFGSFHNCGYQIHNPSTENYFSDRAGKFLSILADLKDFHYLVVIRLGVRSRFYLSAENLTFEELRSRYSNTFLSDKLPEIFGAKIDDVGTNLNFRDGSAYLQPKDLIGDIKTLHAKCWQQLERVAKSLSI